MNGNWKITPIPIPEIIRNAVHTYANEPYHNIIINDLETYGLELLRYFSNFERMTMVSSITNTSLHYTHQGKENIFIILRTSCVSHAVCLCFLFV